jgi:hypothetical protein
MTRTSLVAAIALLTAALLVACTSPADTPSRSHEISTGIDEDGGRLALPGGPSVSVPHGSVEGSGTLVIAGVTTGHTAPAGPVGVVGVTGAYEISLKGGRLVGPITLTFPLAAVATSAPSSVGMPASTAVSLGFFDASVGRWDLVPSRYDATAHTVTATVTHLSWWNPFSWDFDALGSSVTAAYRSLMKVAAPTPVCQHEKKARSDGVTVTSDSGDRIRWCYGLDNGRAVLKVANTKGYPVEVTFPQAWTVENPAGSISIESGLMSLLEKSLAVGRGKRAILLPGGSTASFYPTRATPGGDVRATASSGGYLASALDFGVQTFGMAMGQVPGAPKPKLKTSERVLKEVLDGTCLLGYTRDLSQEIDSLDAASKMMLAALDVSFECLQESWKKHYGLRGFVESFVMVGLSWLATGITTLISGVQGLWDSVAYLAGYRISVRISCPGEVLVLTAVRAYNSARGYPFVGNVRVGPGGGIRCVGPYVTVTLLGNSMPDGLGVLIRRQNGSLRVLRQGTGPLCSDDPADGVAVVPTRYLTALNCIPHHT